MKAFINACGVADSLGNDRQQEVRGLIKFGGREVVKHTLQRLDEIGVSYPVIILTEPQHRAHYEQAFRSQEDKVSIIEYKGFQNPLAVYFTGLRLSGDSDHVLIIADDNLFDFSLKGLVKRLAEVDDNVLAVREAGKICPAEDLQTMNFGTCILDKNEKLIKGSYSFDPNTRVDSQKFILDIYLINQKRLSFFTDFLKDPQLGLSRAAKEWYRDFYAWEPEQGFWADIGKPQLRKAAEKHFSN